MKQKQEKDLLYYKILNDSIIDSQYLIALTQLQRNQKRKKLKTIASKNKVSPPKQQEYTNPNLLFNLKQIIKQNDGPSVGDYDISSPIIKPIIQTYQKKNEVVLIKINHIGGTSSFRNDSDRFASGSLLSIFPMTQNPGPGTYQTIQPVSNRYKQKGKYHQGYSFIKQIIKQTHEASISIPNYEIENRKDGLQYNGIPKHLQSIYNKLNKSQKKQERLRSMPLQKIMNLRKKMDNLPMKSKRNTIDSSQLHDSYEPQLAEDNKTLRQLTQTLYKLNENKKLQQQKQKKLDQLLKGKIQKRSISLALKKQKPYNRQSTTKVQLFNKNMVNILFDKGNKA